MPSSVWADAGSSQILCERTSDSHNVFTKVVRPVPEVPESIQREKNKHSKSRSDTKAIVSPTTKIRTNHHDSELDTFLGLVSSASASERHWIVRIAKPSAVVGEGRELVLMRIIWGLKLRLALLSHNSGAKQRTRSFQTPLGRPYPPRQRGGSQPSMMLPRSLFRSAKCIRRLSPARRFCSSSETRQSDAQLASPSKPRPKRTRKKLTDLPSTFMLPDGTPAKPLGDWRTVNLFKDPSTCMLLYVMHHTRNLIIHFQRAPFQQAKLKATSILVKTRSMMLLQVVTLLVSL